MLKEFDILTRMKQFGPKNALIWNGSSASYNELQQKVKLWRMTLSRAGICQGDCVAFSGEFSPSTVSLLLALMDFQAIVVPLTPLPDAELADRLDIAKVSTLITIDDDDRWRVERFEPTGSHPLMEELRQRERSGLIIFSSGSTGAVKASIIDFPLLISKFEPQRKPYRSITFMMLDHIGGINTLLGILSSGGTGVVTSRRDPVGVCALVERHQVELLPTTPSFLNMLLISQAYKKYDISSLSLITYGTEPMPATTLQSLNEIFPHIRLKQTYGLTEVGILPTKSEDNTSLWIKVGGDGNFETKVVNGTLWIKSKFAMLGYLNAESPFDEDGWMDTGDEVEVRGDFIRILGRNSEIVNIGGEKVFPVEVENVILQLEDVCDVTVEGRPNPILGNTLIAKVAFREDVDDEVATHRIRTHCKHHLAPHKIPSVVIPTSDKLYSYRLKKQRKLSGT